MLVIVDKAYYEQHYETFKPPNTEVRSVYVEGEDHSDDMIHKGLLKSYLKARDELRDYEYQKRHTKKRSEDESN